MDRSLKFYVTTLKVSDLKAQIYSHLRRLLLNQDIYVFAVPETKLLMDEGVARGFEISHTYLEV